MRHEGLGQSLILRMVVALCGMCLFGHVAGASSQPSTGRGAEIRLSSLDPSCRLERRWFGTVPMLAWSIWLRCGSVDMLIVHPWNLISKVRIGSADQALEFVRLFSSEDNFALVQLGGLLEVGEVNTWCPTLRATLGPKRSVLPKVEAHEGSDDARYYVTRLVVAYDQKVYEITETVRRDGFYNELKRATVMRDIRKLGCLHDSP